MLRSRRIQPQNMSAWLNESLARTPDGRYAHRLLMEELSGRSIVWEELTACIQEAHEDARRKLRKALEPTLSPFTGPVIDPMEGYPQDLNEQTLMGYFGEVMAGLIAEHKDVLGQTDWRVPVFLFRFHQVAFQKLEQRRDLRAQGIDPTPADDYRSIIPGRTGDDVLAFLLGPNGDLAAILVCEAKCLTNHDTAKAKKAHEQLSTAARCPSGVIEIIEILGDYQSDEAKEWRNRLMAFRLDPNKQVTRADMLLYMTGDKPKGVKGRVAWLPQSGPSPDYVGKRQLEVVEIHIDNPSEMVKTIYRRAS